MPSTSSISGTFNLPQSLTLNRVFPQDVNHVAIFSTFTFHLPFLPPTLSIHTEIE